VILVDANILMYAAGAEHANKAPSLRYLEAVAESRADGVLDAEVLQEILLRYRSIHRWADGRAVYDHARAIFPMVMPITAEVLDVARGLLDKNIGISARDALHAAVVAAYDLEGICSYDQGFDHVPGLRRTEPDAVIGD